jgi:hypothetical protein
MKKKQMIVGIFGILLVFLLALGACGGGGGGGDDPDTVGTNEVAGKTFYMGDSQKTVFNSNLTFETFNWMTVDFDTLEEDWVGSYKGSYGYNSETKTITPNVTQVAYENAEGNLVYMNQSQLENALIAEVDEEVTEMKKTQLWLIAAVLAINTGEIDIWDLGFDWDYESDYDEAIVEWLKENETEAKPMAESGLAAAGITSHEDLYVMMATMYMSTGEDITTMAEYKNYLKSQVAEAFNPRSYSYTITSDGALLGQVVYANKGSDELKGNKYTLASMFGWGDSTEYTFAANGNTYSYTTQSYDENWEPIDVVISGTYYYDATQKKVWLCPTTIGGKNMAQYYNAVDISDYMGPLTGNDNIKASETNSAFNTEELTYNSQSKTLERGGFGGLWAFNK